ncbi:hypothetical protein HN873_005238 [Arachis hypogaea]
MLPCFMPSCHGPFPALSPFRRPASHRLRYISFFVIDSREANKSGNNWLPLPCVIVALLILGFNEFMTLLKNPLYLILIFIGYLVTKSLWVQHDVAASWTPILVYQASSNYNKPYEEASRGGGSSN